VEGASVVVLGSTHAELGGSELARRHDLRDGLPPRADLGAATALHDLVCSLVADRVVAGVHDCSLGGLAVAIAEMAIAGSCGVVLDGPGADLSAPVIAWFSESASRVVVAVAPDVVEVVVAMAESAGVPASGVGVAGGDRIFASGAFDVALADATDAWRHGMERMLGPIPESVA
jgi:phosphoribosylformylglycinamidine synthase